MTQSNADQIDYWNAAAGQTWASYQQQLDRQIAPLGEAAMAALAPEPGQKVLDIGCGCGDTSLELARRVAPDGAVLGVDISRPMLDVAKARQAEAGLTGLAFREADAQTAELRPASFDAAFSRFGVMFFNDPPAAFTNIRKALKPGARLAFVCWRPLTQNGWMLIPFQAALKHVNPPMPGDPLAPGPFAFADPDRVRGILGAAGFEGITITPFDTRIGGSDLDKTLELTFRVGPLGAILRENPQARDVVSASIREALEAHLENGVVMMPAAVWIVTATA
jgi:SAM-dependent methyltransferase